VILFASLIVMLLAEVIRRVERRYGAEYAARGLA
jgi:hypothetical protein